MSMVVLTVSYVIMWLLLCNRFSMQVGMRIGATTTSSVLALLASSGVCNVLQSRRNCKHFIYLAINTHCLPQICYVLHRGEGLISTFYRVSGVCVSGIQGCPDWENKCSSWKKLLSISAGFEPLPPFPHSSVTDIDTTYKSKSYYHSSPCYLQCLITFGATLDT